MAKPTLIIESNKLSFVFASSEPIPENDLMNWLIDVGFDKIEDIPKRIGTSTFGIERTNIARRKTSEVLYEPETGVLGVAGKNLKDNYAGFELIHKMLDKNEIDLETNIQSFEMVLNAKIFIKGKIKPLTKIKNFVYNNNFSKFDKIMEDKVIPFDVRFCSSNAIDTSENIRKLSNWFNVHVFPKISNPNYYSIQIVYRNISLKKMISFFESIEERIFGILSVIVGEK